MSFIIDNNMGGKGDHIYNALLDAHQGLTTDQSHRLNARLVLILVNQVGATDMVEQAIELAARGVSAVPAPSANEES